MNIRVILLVVPFFLSGCSTVSNFSWSKLSPTNWFGSSLELNDSGLSGITSATPLNEKSLDKALNGDYRLRKGMGISNGQVISFYEAMDDDKVALIFRGNANNRVEYIEVMDKSVKTPNGTEIGTKFSELYQKAFGVCEVGTEENSGSVVCRSPESRQVTYVFSGSWMGSASIMPPDDKLRSWTISKMIWQSK